MEYLITFLVGAFLLGLLFVNKYFIKKENLGLKIVSILGMIVLVTRMFCYTSVIADNSDNFWGLASSPLNNNALTGTCLVLIWLSYSFILFTLMRPFFNVKFANNVTKYLAPLFYLVFPFFLKPSATILAGEKTNLLMIFYSLECAIGLAISLYYLINSLINKEKVNYKDILWMFVGLFTLSIFTLPPYFLQYMFGFQKVTNLWVIKELGPQHRIVLLMGLLIPLLINYLLRDKSEEFKRYNLLFMCLGVLIGFLVRFDYRDLTTPWTWPFHLCNTALFILPLVLAFKMKRLFYFTYFINVVGAFFAMIMPNYGDSTNIMALEFVRFWYNHYIAFFMPILFVSLGMFTRPKLKQFIYSMVGFLGYFILVLTLNVVFTEMGHSVDYFFINSDFIADKLGQWAENIFDMEMALKVGEHTYVFHPLYQTIFFFGYVLIGLGVWFIYEEGYRIADNGIRLRKRLKVMKAQELELKEALKGRRMDEPMEKDAGIKYELKHFSKRYGSSDHYSVKDASFTVHGGEIFGFLGPNGAGKSTIIKSTVGIQPITDGNISICGFDVGTQPVECKSLIGFVPDHYALYEKLTGREYVNYIADIYGVSEEDRNRRIERYIKIFELEASIDNKIKTYSHGMKQKITIMSALVHDPKVWILDEPLTGLDPNSIYQVKECMKEHAKKGNIVFFSSHIIDIVEKLCERVAIIKHGKIQCVKSVKEIEESGLTLEEFYLKTIGNNEIDEEYLKLDKAH